MYLSAWKCIRKKQIHMPCPSIGSKQFWTDANYFELFQIVLIENNLDRSKAFGEGPVQSYRRKW